MSTANTNLLERLVPTLHVCLHPNLSAAGPRVWDGLLAMAMAIRPDLQDDRFSGPGFPEISEIVHHENHDVEGVSVEVQEFRLFSRSWS